MNEIDNILEIMDGIPEDKPQIKIFDGRGRGRKQCPKCQKFIGVRHKICVCKHVFQKKPEPIPEVDGPEYVEARNFVSALGYNHIGFRVLFAPRGTCPVKFNGDVPEWADEVVERYYGDNFILSPIALRYMLDKFSPILSDSYMDNRIALREWIDQINLGEGNE